ncbi:MAG: hypothetical protein J2P25_14455 [Nocardiopsaceae bacterium]|nr:hypothetical protein [Nocardiopsaceae bacterium]
MRPGRFQDFAVDVLKNTPGTARVQTLADAGDTQHPFGLAVATERGESRWQIIGQLPDGGRHDTPDTPVEGTPAPAGEGPRPGDAPEAWLAAAFAAAESPEVERIERWSTRDDGRPDHIGVTLFFHNSAKIFVRLL